MSEHKAADPSAALLDMGRRLRDRGMRFALVGGLAVSIRAEVRFTRDVDIAIAVGSDAEVEALTRSLRGDGFESVAVVLQEQACSPHVRSISRRCERRWLSSTHAGMRVGKTWRPSSTES